MREIDVIALCSIVSAEQGVDVITLVGTEPHSTIPEAGITGTHGLVTTALHHALTAVQRGSRHSVLSLVTRAVQWLRREEKSKAWTFGRLTRNVTFDATPQ
jgi:hypothetical protein